ncbi:auxin efflux carrier [Coniochaeta sp. 2T2.1]|nr:auxin efflux carrier [Coniochaeta sp. 2T2.1]
MAPTGLFESFLGALQASLSVLLVISYGGIAAKLKILNTDNTKPISKLCVRLFLPALLLTKIGAELHAGSAARYGVILLWALATHAVSFALGMFGSYVLGMPDWTTVAVMFNNSTSYPLLLFEALGETGILQSLIVTDESTEDAIERAKSYFLVYATVSSCLTFAVGPRLIDSENAPEADEEEDDDKDLDDEPGTDGAADERDAEANESTGLLGSRGSVTSNVNSFLGSINKPSDLLPDHRRARIISKQKWKRLSPRTRWWLLFISDFFNAPLVGAILGAVIGLTPPLHKAFFADAQEGGIFTAWLTSSLKNIGRVFVPLPVVVAGVSLFSLMRNEKFDRSTVKKIPWLTWSYILGVRFLLWPVASIGIIYLVSSRTGFLGDDPMLWFTLMMMPTGPPAMKLVTLVQVSGGSEEEESNISRLLTLAYMMSPLLSLTVVGSLKAAQAVM